MKDVYWSTDEETYNLDTLDEVIEHLLFDNQPNEIVGSEVTYGRAKPYNTDWVDASDVLEIIADRAYDEGGEFAEDFPDVSKEAKEELQAFLSDWQSKHCVASFYRVVDVKKYIITQEDVDKCLVEK